MWLLMKGQCVLFVSTLEYLLEYCDEIPPEPSPLQADKIEEIFCHSSEVRSLVMSSQG